ncbi:MAG: pentapeptide repeat-containing protein, partial [Bacteroidetes bacterium]|nr:pentapeptide repeat-containing protein [Bacteroidota bacterium]
FIDCNFNSCNLSMVKLSGTSFINIKFNNCKMLGMPFNNCNQFGLLFSFQSYPSDQLQVVS